MTNKTKRRYQNIIIHIKEYEHYFKDYYFYFNEFDLFDRKNTKIINKFINPHKKYNNNNEKYKENLYWEKEDDFNIKINNYTINDNSSTGTISNVEQHGDNFVKNRIHSNKKHKLIIEKDNSIDKEFKELINEIKKDEDSPVLESNSKKVNIINNSKFKEKIRKYMNIKIC